MKCVADGALKENGTIIGVIPRKLQELELIHPNLSETYITESMQERKLLIAQLADAFIALPGGFGTLEELAEVTTLTQLNYHDKPVGLLNINGYFNLLIKWLEHAAQENFIHKSHQHLISISDDPNEMLQLLKDKQHPKLELQLKDIKSNVPQ